MRVFTQFDDVLASLWPQTATPFYSYRWHKAWYEHFGANESLCIFAGHDGIVPLAIKDTVAHFTGGEEIADYLDALGRPDWNEAVDTIKTRGAKTLLLRNIPEGSSTLSNFSHEKEDTTPMLMLPKMFGLYAESLERKKRHELRRKMRRFEEQYKTSIQQRVDTELLVTLMRNNSEKKEFLTPETESFFHALPSLGASQLTLLTNDQPIATTLVFIVDTSLLLYNSGYSVEGAGWYLKAKLIEWAIGNKLTSVNFLQGDERYKYDFGAHDRFVYRVTQTL